MNDKTNRTSQIDCDKQVKTLKENRVYRVSDLFFREGMRWQRDRETILTNPEYRNTILYDYLRTKEGEEDFHALRRVVREHTSRKQYKIPDEDDLVVHMRLGDVMKVPQRFNKAIARYSKLYNKTDLEPHSFSKTVVVTALHFGANELNGKYFYSDLAKEKSFEVLRAFERRTNEFGLTLSVVSNENVDSDICFMASSRFFVKGLSGFSEIVARCLPAEARIFEL
jgi:hypothetical protein